MAEFAKALPKVLSYEGAYDNDPKDPGGETCFGITRAFEPNWPGWARVAEIKATGVGSIFALIEHDAEVQKHVAAYYEKLWDSFFLTQILSQELAECIYNGCINQGAKRVLAWLQYCVNALSVISEDVKEDGVMGAGTVNQISALEAKGLGDLLLKLLQAQRIAAYTVTVHNREDSLKYIKGWIARIEKGG